MTTGPRPLDITGLLADARLLVVGGTGFLGKVWLSMLLHRFGGIEHIYLVVRPRDGLDSEARFWTEIAPSQVFDPLRELHPGPAYEEFIRAKITPIPGDVSLPFAGIPEDVREKLRGRVTALVNAAGVVDFNPPLDEALDVNAFGMQTLVELARDLDEEGSLPFLHTSTCYVAGSRTGQVDEVHPSEFPFPRADELERSHWDPDREIAECVDVVEHVRHRTNDSFRQSAFLAEAKERLLERGEPTRGSALEDELARVRRRYEEQELSVAGRERAKFWGWSNTYTYTKSIGEQVLCASGLPFTIVRPAVIESSLAFPEPGWNEGITTSAPIMYLAMKGMTGMPASTDSVLDVVPADMVAAGMILALAELLDGSQAPVYHLGTSDTNPLSMHRLIELTGLYKRKKYRGQSSGNPFLNWIQANYETVPVSVSRWAHAGPGKTRDRLTGIANSLAKLTDGARVLAPALNPANKLLSSVAKTMDGTARVVDQYVPFTATHNYRFSCQNARSALARVPEGQRGGLPWTPETLDWRAYWLEVHVPGVEKHVWPRIQERIHRPVRALRPHDSLLSFLDEIAERHGHAPALLLPHPDGFTRVSFLELRDRAHATAARLHAQGIRQGDRVFLAGRNHPDWPVAYFGILRAGAVAIPLDPSLEIEQAETIAATAQGRAALLDSDSATRFGEALGVPCLSLSATTAPGPCEGLPELVISSDDIASILFTSGTTGEPKGVLLSHANFCSLLGSLAQVFELGAEDRILSVLPLHHTFEFTCGLLLPLSRGTRVVYLDEISSERLSTTLRDARITAMVGVPALWQLLERRMMSQVTERGPLVRTLFDGGLELNRWLGKTAGIDAGRLLFGTVHQGLGGNIRLLISGGAALPRDTHQFFAGLGLHLAEGYGLTEAAPVLTVDAAGPGTRPGSVGRAIPGVELKILEPDGEGVGEVLARGPNIMAGYFRNEEATEAVLSEDGWLHTGDLGRLDHRGRLVVVGRAKDVVVTASGENLYLDDIEARLGQVPHIEELALVGLADGKGGERLGLLAVRSAAAAALVPSGRDPARATLKQRIESLPIGSRPAVVHLVDVPLPRTATRKVKRRQVRDLLERIHAAAESAGKPQRLDTGSGGSVRQTIAGVCGQPAEEITGSTRMVEDLAFDSLMWVELASALDELPDVHPDTEALASCSTVAEIEELTAQPPVPLEDQTEVVQAPFHFPAPLVSPLRKLLRTGQRTIYEQLLDVEVTGRALIPKNRQVLVISNHCSHIDMGLVKTALGDYGEKMVALAAQDYFFEGNSLWVAYFEQLTNLRPLDRKSSYRQSLRQAIAAVEEGHVVLIFPEGGRQGSGALQQFKPLVGKLILETGMDILPVHLRGTHDVLPKGAAVPRGRKVGVRIGTPIPFSEIQRLTESMKTGEAARGIAQLLHDAVASLRDGQILDVTSLDNLGPAEDAAPVDPMADLFAELTVRYRPDVTEVSGSWYFSLGGEEGRWTVVVDDEGCHVNRGRPSGGAADCVIKTSQEFWTRMVREAYVPEVAEFVSGAIKTSDLERLQHFALAFQLGPLDSSKADEVTA